MDIGEYLKSRGVDSAEAVDSLTYGQILALTRDMEIEKCRDDIEYYVENYCVFEDKDAEELIQPFIMWDAQKEALRSIHEHRRNIILKARQLGFSWLVISYASWVCLMRSGRTAIALSRTEDEAKELVRRLSVEYENMTFLIREYKSDSAKGWPGPTFERQSLQLIVPFPGSQDSVFKAFPSSPGACRSFTADLAIFDEWAYQQWADDIWVSAAPTINRPTGGKFIGLSTNNHGSLFEDMFTNNDNGFNKIFIPWFADPRRNQEWYDETVAMIGVEETKQEYPASIDEALSVAGGLFFPEINSKQHISEMPIKGAVNRYVSIDYGFDMFAAIFYAVDANYHAQAYREIHEPNLNAMQAADTLRDLVGDEKITAYLAPPDLWNRQATTGKSTAIIFEEHGIPLTKVDNSMFNGCMRMKEWLYASEGEQARFTILKGTCNNLYRCMKKILQDKNKPNQYAKQPHELTHSVDSFRYFAVYWTLPPDIIKNGRRKKWTSDMYEDYKNANEADKLRLIEKWGEPE